MSEIERLAKVLTDKGYACEAGTEDAIRILLQALQSPSEETLLAGQRAFEAGRDIWREMIEHILDEG